MADLDPHPKRPERRQGGRWRGMARIAEDFDAPMPEIEGLFEAAGLIR